MQPDTHQHPTDHSPLPTPSSPPLSNPFHRHHPTAQAPDDPISTLRQRITTPDTIRINIATPFADSGESSSSRRKEGWPVPRSMRVEELKAELGAGRFGEGEIWEREGMRLVWQGRIVRDEEKLGDVIRDTRDSSQVHTLHLVARRQATSSRPVQLPSTEMAPTPTIPVPASRSPLRPSPHDNALQDTMHYLYFTARHHLCHLLNSSPLRWEDTVPPPVVDQAKARLAVMSVVRALATLYEGEEGWAQWEGAFIEDDVERLQAEWQRLSKEGGVEGEIMALWKSRVGREWSESSAGESVVVELDSQDYRLQLPPLKLLTPAQSMHLLIYLRITSLLPLLNDIYEAQVSTPLPAPTPTLTPPNPNVRVIYQRSIRIRLPHIPLVALQYAFFSAAKIVAMLWMLTRDMHWSDTRFWVIGGGAVGYWIADALNRVDAERRRVAAVARAAAPPAPTLTQEDNNNNQIQADAPVHAAQAQAGLAPTPPRQQSAPRPRPPLALSIPLIQLETDSRVLRLTRSGALEPSQRVEREPPSWLMMICLPVFLWVVTLLPEWEAVRSRAIRRRERAMRVIVGEMNTSPPAPALDQSEGTAVDNEIEGQGTTPQAEAPVPAPRVLPDGLGRVAKRYYERVMARGEGIDWEEEREAQRALGIADEEQAGLGRLL